MADPTGARTGEARMDAASLYREEIYTDRAAGTLRVLVPVKSDGSTDAARPALFIGEAQILTNMGPLPISFEVDAKNLAEAIENYGEAAKVGIERAVRELQELRRQASSSIVLPGAGAAAGLTGAMPPGSLGGGKIKLP
jgi:hypothetical protein